MHGRFTVGLAVAAVLLVSACSKGSTTSDASPASQEATATSTEAAEPVAVTYTASEYAFDGPDTLPAGTSDITMENVGTADHEMAIVRLDKNQDWTEEQVIEYINNDPTSQPKWAVPVAGLLTESGPPIIGPGESAPVVFLDFSEGSDRPTADKDGSLEPGTYLFLCFVGDPPFHAGMGMVKKVTVS